MASSCCPNTVKSISWTLGIPRVQERQRVSTDRAVVPCCISKLGGCWWERPFPETALICALEWSKLHFWAVLWVFFLACSSSLETEVLNPKRSITYILVGAKDNHLISTVFSPPGSRKGTSKNCYGIQKQAGKHLQLCQSPSGCCLVLSTTMIYNYTPSKVYLEKPLSHMLPF